MVKWFLLFVIVVTSVRVGWKLAPSTNTHIGGWFSSLACDVALIGGALTLLVI